MLHCYCATLVTAVFAQTVHTDKRFRDWLQKSLQVRGEENGDDKAVTKELVTRCFALLNPPVLTAKEKEEIRLQEEHARKYKY
jgi:hypothetical protein